MKKLVLLLFAIATVSFAQQAQQYFPASTGFKWFYTVTPLDSLNQPIDSLATNRVDSFTVVAQYMEKSANFVLSKQGPHKTVLSQNYLDTSFISLTGTDGYEFFRVASADSLSGVFSHLGSSGVGNLYRTLKSFEKWYELYRFSNVANIPYSIFKYDTTIAFDTLSLPLRFELKGTRLADKTVTTEAGVFTCKRFYMAFSISYLLTVPPFPTVAIPFSTSKDTVSIAPGNWIVESVVPTTTIDFSAVGKGTWSIPGSKTSLIPAFVLAVASGSRTAVNGFVLHANYPNPFNPSTNIRFTLPEAGNVSLAVYDLLGSETASLLNAQYLAAGTHEYSFNAANLPSGMYLVRVTAGHQQLTRKILLMK